MDAQLLFAPGAEQASRHSTSLDGRLRIVRWASDFGLVDGQLLEVDLGVRPVDLAHGNATGEGLVSNGLLGADVIRLAAGDGFGPHTHPGDHLLIVVGGRGTITCGGKIYPTRAGELYMVEGHVPHAVGAITDHVILAVGSPHRPVDAPDRMAPVGYAAVTAAVDDLHCLICDLHARYPRRLHDAGCPHCPCVECHPYDEVRRSAFGVRRDTSGSPSNVERRTPNDQRLP